MDSLLTQPYTNLIATIQHCILTLPTGDLADEPVVGGELLRVLRRAAVGRHRRHALHHRHAGKQHH